MLATARMLTGSTRKRQLKYLGYIMRKKGLENLTLTGIIQGKRSKGKQSINCLMRLLQQLLRDIEITNSTKVYKVKKLWWAMMKDFGTLKKKCSFSFLNIFKNDGFFRLCNKFWLLLFLIMAIFLKKNNIFQKWVPNIAWSVSWSAFKTPILLNFEFSYLRLLKVGYLKLDY